MNGNGHQRRAAVHAAPWNRDELHLGTADDCYTCNRQIHATLESIERADHEDNRVANVYATIGAAVLFVVVLVAVVVNIWSSL